MKTALDENDQKKAEKEKFLDNQQIVDEIKLDKIETPVDFLRNGKERAKWLRRQRKILDNLIIKNKKLP